METVLRDPCCLLLIAFAGVFGAGWLVKRASALLRLTPTHRMTVETGTEQRDSGTM